MAAIAQKNLDYCTQLQNYMNTSEPYMAPEHKDFRLLEKVSIKMLNFHGEFTPEYEKIEASLMQAVEELNQMPLKERDAAAEDYLSTFKESLETTIQLAKSILMKSPAATYD